MIVLAACVAEPDSVGTTAQAVTECAECDLPPPEPMDEPMPSPEETAAAGAAAGTGSSAPAPATPPPAIDVFPTGSTPPTSSTPPPSVWTPMPGTGTTPADISWLLDFDEASAPVANTVNNTVWGLIVPTVRDYLWESARADILDDCTTGSLAARAACLGASLHEYYNVTYNGDNALPEDDTMVCRHHAIALESLLEEIGVDDATISCGYDEGGHCWVEATIDIDNDGTRDRCLLDAYNAIYTCYVPPPPPTP